MKAYAIIRNDGVESIHVNLTDAEKVGAGFLYTVYGDDLKDCIREAHKHCGMVAEEKEDYYGICIDDPCQWDEHYGEVCGFDMENKLVNIRYYPYDDDTVEFGSVSVHNYFG